MKKKIILTALCFMMALRGLFASPLSFMPQEAESLEKGIRETTFTRGLQHAWLYFFQHPYEKSLLAWSPAFPIETSQGRISPQHMGDSYVNDAEGFEIIPSLSFGIQQRFGLPATWELFWSFNAMTPNVGKGHFFGPTLLFNFGFKRQAQKKQNCNTAFKMLLGSAYNAGPGLEWHFKPSFLLSDLKNLHTLQLSVLSRIVLFDSLFSSVIVPLALRLQPEIAYSFNRIFNSNRVFRFGVYLGLDFTFNVISSYTIYGDEEIPFWDAALRSGFQFQVGKRKEKNHTGR